MKDLWVWFWWLMTIAVMVWYSTITILVTVKGAADVKHMLSRLSGEEANQDELK